MNLRIRKVAGRERDKTRPSNSRFSRGRSTVISSKHLTINHLHSLYLMLAVLVHLRQSLAGPEQPNESLQALNLSSPSPAGVGPFEANTDQAKSEKIAQLAEYLNQMSPSVGPEVSNLIKGGEEFGYSHSRERHKNGSPERQPEEHYLAEESGRRLNLAGVEGGKLSANNSTISSNNTTMRAPESQPARVAQMEPAGERAQATSPNPKDEFTADMLRDNQHESDKLVLQERLQGRKGERPAWQKFAGPKLELSGWLPAGETRPASESAPKKPEAARSETSSQKADGRSSRKITVEEERLANGIEKHEVPPQVSAQVNTFDLEAEDGYPVDQSSISYQVGVPAVKLKQNYSPSEHFRSQQHLSFQSSLQPKHVAPPASNSGESEEAPKQWQAPENFLIEPSMSYILPAGYPYPGRPENSESSSPAKGRFVANLKSKSLGFLPRLTARLFNKSNQAEGKPVLQQGDEMEVLNQQHSFSMPTHLNTPAGGSQASPSAGRARGVKLFSRGAVKGLFTREPSHLMQPAPVARIPSVLLGYPKTRVATPKAPEMEAVPSRQPQSSLILMNGQVYSVLNPSGDGASDPKAVFDHQMSDTSEFPVFEAMSMQHMMSSSSPAVLEPTESGSYSQAPPDSARCDRPRHVIQADRTVVNHILQSQQNFVIARVPIKKSVRPEAASSAALPFHHQQGPANLYHAYPVPFASNLAPSSGLFRPTNMNYALANTNNIPSVYGGFPQAGSTIEVSVPRSSLFSSLANLVKSIRYARSLPRPLEAARLVAGSSPSAVFVEGPVLLSRKTGAGARNLRRASQLGRISLQKHFGANYMLGTLDGQRDYSTAGSAQIAHQLDRDEQAGYSSREGSYVDPMRRLLMLKTATENEVCSPVSEEGAKIKYSCVPNYCVALAIANSTGQLADSSYRYKGSNSMQQQRHLKQNQDERVQVEQFEDAPAGSKHYKPLVSYTHINAYHPPAISKLTQPLHQQFVASSINELASVPDEAPTGTLDGKLFQPFGQASSMPVDPTTGQLLYQLQYPSGQAFPVYTSTTKRPRQSPSSVTYGTAYVRTSPKPAESFRLKEKPARVLVRPTRVREPYEDSDDGAPQSAVDPSEFVSAVDEQLERPIKVPASGRKRRRKVVEEKWRFVSTRRPTAASPSTPPPLEKGGSGAENSPVESETPGATAMFAIQPALIQKQRRGLANGRPEVRPYPPSQLSNSAPDDYNEDDDEDDEESLLEESGPPGGSLHGVPPSLVSQTNPIASGGQLYQQRLNMSRAIPVVNRPGEATLRKSRRHQPSTTAAPVEWPGARYGQRQSTPLPAPEKADEPSELAGLAYPVGNNLEDEPPILAPDFGPANGTDCDCAINNTAADFPAITPERPSSIPTGRTTGTSRPSNKFDPRADYSVTLAPKELSPPRDRRRQTFSSSSTSTTAGPSTTIQTGVGMLRYTTRKPYNLRLTTYKNLSPNSTAGQQVVAGAAGSHAVQHQQLGELPSGGEAPPEVPTDGKQTQFDEPSVQNEPPRLHVTYNEPEVRTHDTPANLIPDEAELSQAGAENSPPTPLPISPAQAERRRKRRRRVRLRPEVPTSAPLASTNSSGTRTPEANSTSDQAATFKPSSVNEILAQARRESQSNGTIEMDGSANTPKGSQETNNGLKQELERARLPKSLARLADVDRPLELDDGHQDPEARDGDSNTITPHQYQIQIRWSNSSGSEQAQLPAEGKHERAGEEELALERMRERVKDRLFEHREEEHWHDKKWLRGAKRRKLVNGRWLVLPESPNGNNFDYGPNANARDTPIGAQLANEPTRAEVEKHFAIPTANFRQSAKFLEWVQREVDLNEEPTGPTG